MSLDDAFNDVTSGVNFGSYEKASQTQVGGDHYKDRPIQPFQYSMKNGLDPLQHTVVKYVTRFREKNGVEDLEKAKHCLDLLIQFEKTGEID